MQVARFEIYRDQSGEYHWKFRTYNEVVASDEGSRQNLD
jgi:uncharacterized protein YegP (UPF0339 family)